MSIPYRWVIVGAGALMTCVAIGAMFLLAVFLDPMSTETGWSRAAISSAMTLNVLVMALGNFGWGMASDRFGTRIVVLAGIKSPHVQGRFRLRAETARFVLESLVLETCDVRTQIFCVGRREWGRHRQGAPALWRPRTMLLERGYGYEDVRPFFSLYRSSIGFDRIPGLPENPTPFADRRQLASLRHRQDLRQRPRAVCDPAEDRAGASSAGPVAC